MAKIDLALFPVVKAATIKWYVDGKEQVGDIKVLRFLGYFKAETPTGVCLYHGESLAKALNAFDAYLKYLQNNHSAKVIGRI